MALLQLPKASSRVPAQPPFPPRAKGQLCSPCADRHALSHFPDEGFAFKVTQGVEKQHQWEHQVYGHPAMFSKDSLYCIFYDKQFWPC